ncbi:hypothetical protein ACJX0J_039815 [Zea mays]
MANGSHSKDLSREGKIFFRELLMSGDSDMVVRAYDQMKSFFESIAYNMAEKVWHYIEAMVSHGIEINCYIVGYLLQMLFLIDMHNAHLWFLDMDERGLSDVIPDVMLAKGLTPDVYAQGEIAKAEDLLQEMTDKGMKPDGHANKKGTPFIHHHLFEYIHKN